MVELIVGLNIGEDFILLLSNYKGIETDFSPRKL
jgi:hypothetical protein